MHSPILSNCALYKSGLDAKSVDPFHRTRGVVVENSEEEDAFARGDMESSDMGEAAMVPGADSIFCDVSRSTSMGVLPNLTAVVGVYVGNGGWRG